MPWFAVNLPNWHSWSSNPWTYPGSIEGHLLEHAVPVDIINELVYQEKKKLHNYLHTRERKGYGSRYY